MYFFISLIPATIWVVIGYFVLFSSSKTQGAIQMFGQILAIWLFVIAALIPLMGAYVTIAGGFPSLDSLMQSMHPGVRP